MGWLGLRNALKLLSHPNHPHKPNDIFKRRVGGNTKRFTFSKINASSTAEERGWVQEDRLATAGTRKEAKAAAGGVGTMGYTREVCLRQHG